jgi:hypothetical protein
MCVTSRRRARDAAAYRRRDPTATPLYPVAQYQLGPFPADASASDPVRHALELEEVVAGRRIGPAAALTKIGRTAHVRQVFPA